MKALALLPLLLSTLTSALMLPRQTAETVAVETVAAAPAGVIAVSVIGGKDFTIHPTPTTAAQANAGDVIQTASASEDAPIYHPQVISFKHLNNKEPILILPFHLQLTEHCAPSSSTPLVKGFWQNGDQTIVFDSLKPNMALSYTNPVLGYPNLRIGPFSSEAGSLAFRYANTVFYQDGEANVCKWEDGETWRECGECRAGLWSRGRLDCGSGGGGGGGGERVS
jgi:hypothetical protein